MKVGSGGGVILLIIAGRFGLDEEVHCLVGTAAPLVLFIRCMATGCPST